MIAHDVEVVQAWLSKPWPTGVIAAGGCSADGRSFCRIVSSDSLPQLPDAFWVMLNEAVAQLAAYGCGDGREAWVFETAVLHLTGRADGAWAAALIPREVSAGVQAAVQARLREFVAMVE
jgi:hypothetical protein